MRPTAETEVEVAGGSSVAILFFGNLQITRLCYPNFWQQTIQTKFKQQFHEK